MRARKTIGFLVIALVAALVGVWLYALAGSGAQLESLFRPRGSTAPAEPTPRAAPVVERSPSLTVEPPSVSAAADAEAVGAPAGPIDAGAFAELLESGLLDDESSDAAAVGELRDALGEAAESAAAREPE